jgi:hypothetical protein
MISKTVKRDRRAGSGGVSPESVLVDIFLEMRAPPFRGFPKAYVLAGSDAGITLRRTMSSIAALPK